MQAIHHRTRHELFNGHLSDAPGRCETWTEWVTYLGRSRWRLSIEGSDFGGQYASDADVMHLSTKKLIEWALERDSEDVDADCGDSIEADDDDANLGPASGIRSRALLVIAKAVGATHCERRLRCLASPAGREPKPPSIQAVTGVARHIPWRGAGTLVYTVQTNLGQGYLCPLGPDGTAHLVLGAVNSHSSGWAVTLTRRVQAALTALAPEMDRLAHV